MGKRQIGIYLCLFIRLGRSSVAERRGIGGMCLVLWTFKLVSVNYIDGKKSFVYTRVVVFCSLKDFY